MYLAFLKNMAGMGNNKQQSVALRKESNRVSSYSDAISYDDLQCMTNLLFQLKESLRNVSLSFAEKQGDRSMIIRNLHRNIIQVLTVLKDITERHPKVNTQEMFAVTQTLVKYVQSSHFPGVNEIERMVSDLAMLFSKSISRHVLPRRDPHESVGERREFKRNDSRLFGVELEKHILSREAQVPFIVTMCIKEIESHGMQLKGIYRVSAVKSKVNELCEDLEKSGNRVKLNNVSPHIIASVLKMYLRQLPQPLFTFSLYPEFIRIAKTYGSDKDGKVRNVRQCISELRKTLSKLPSCHYVTASVVIRHLHRISKESQVNNMSVYNLAVVFGPTLLHCIKNTTDEGCKSALIDNTHQIHAIELMITLADSIF